MILEKIKEIIAENLQTLPEEVTMETVLEELGADSLDMFQIVVALEEIFDIEITPEEADGFKTVADVVNYIEEKKEEY